jgi:hypothetical protein
MSRWSLSIVAPLSSASIEQARESRVTNQSEKDGHTDSDEWKNSQQNQQKGSTKKGVEGAFGNEGHSVKDNQSGMTGEPGQSQGMDTLTSQPSKNGNKG